MIVFCNTIKACEALHSFLSGEGFPVLYFNKHQSFQERKQHFQDYVKGDKMILVTTDISSRGLDTTMVDHVVMYDFPKNGIDYLHRAGRTGRNGEVGQVTSLVGRKDRRLAATIEQTIKMRKPMGWRPTERILGNPNPKGRPKGDKPRPRSPSTNQERRPFSGYSKRIRSPAAHQ